MITVPVYYFNKNIETYVDIASRGEEIEIILTDGKTLKLEVKDVD